MKMKFQSLGNGSENQNTNTLGIDKSYIRT